MYLNLLGREWCIQPFQVFLDHLSEFYKIKLILVDKTTVHQINYKERMVDYLIIESWSGRSESYEINGFMDHAECKKVSKLFCNFMEKYPFFNSPNNEYKEMLCNEVRAVLEINNELSLTPESRISFAINELSEVQREKLVDLIMTIDSSVPDVFIEIDLNSSDMIQANALYDTLERMRVD